MRNRLRVVAVFLVAVALALPAAAAPTQASFSNPTDFAVGDGPASIAVGDFNGDGDPDLAVANAADTVSVLLGGAGASFGAATDFAAGPVFNTGPVSGAIAVGDFNEDGDPDLAVANDSADTVSVLLGGAGGSFGPRTAFATGDQPVAIAVGDFNADGDPDLATANLEAHSVSVLLGGAGGSFGAATNFAGGFNPESIAAGDFNGDGDPDLALGSTFSDNVSVLLGGAGGSFGAVTSFGSGEQPVSIAVGDFNGDSDPDVAVAAAFDDVVSVLLGGASGSFGGPTNFATGRIPRSVAVGDFNGDSDPDLAVANSGLFGQSATQNVSVLLGGAGGSFGAPTSFAAGTFPWSVAVGDFNGDSHPDLAVANQGSATVSVLRNANENSAPSASANTYATSEDDQLMVSAPGVLGNDSDADGDALRATLVSGPAHGTLTLNANGSFSYTPAADYNGPDSFTYKANDGPAESNTATVSLTVSSVNDAPACADVSTSANEDTPIDSDPSCSDVDSSSLTYAIVAQPAHGTANVAAGKLRYTPAPDYNGPDSFTYKANDGSADSNTATVSITVSAVNDPPKCLDVSASTSEETPVDLAPSCSDVDGDTLTYAIVSQPAHGTASVVTGSLLYAPAADYNGPDSFTYKASDDGLDSNTATARLTVNPVNDAPTVTVAAGGSCGGNDRSGAINLTVADVDTAAGILTLSGASSNQTLVPSANLGFGGTGANRTLTATAASGRTGSATVTITVSDGAATGTVTVTVRAGGNGTDTIAGNAGADIMLGQNGDDTLNGLAGNDLLCGGNGNDTLNGGDNADTMAGGMGNDRLTGGTGADRFSGGPGTDTATDLSAAQGDTQDGTIP